MEYDLSSHTVAELRGAANPYYIFHREEKRSKSRMIEAISKINATVRSQIIHRLINNRNAIRTFTHDNSGITVENDFMVPCSSEESKERIKAFIDHTSNTSLSTAVCVSCAREIFQADARRITINEIPNQHRLSPTKPHPAHNLTNGMLLEISSSDSQWLCLQCEQHLLANRKPPLSLANGMWVGEIPWLFSQLTLPERILIARYYPAAYIMKLSPKAKGAQYWDQNSKYSGLRGNVSTYKLNTSDIANIVSPGVLPPPPKILPAIIAITFVGPNNLPETTLPDLVRVRRSYVHRCLKWCHRFNVLYGDVTISLENLALLPRDGIPEELLATTRYSSDTETLAEEHETYVPESDGVIFPASGVISVDSNVPDELQYNTENIEPAAIPINTYGTIDVNGGSVPDNDILAHAFSNSIPNNNEPSYKIRRGNAFVNEYARIDKDTLERTDGGPSNPNHLLGAFPVLFPYGLGGFEVQRDVNVSYEKHAQWALEYHDKRFRTDLRFMFQVFGVIQKRQVCRAATLQVKRSTFIQHQALLQTLCPSDLIKASSEETRRAPFSNEAVRALRKHVTAVRSNVVGTDESRVSIRSKIWSTTVIHGPPSIWLTINPSDMSDPIAQVFAGEEINMDNFEATLGPTSTQRSINIASDPYAGAKFFHFMIELILKDILGIQGRKSSFKVQRERGIFGKIAAYIGTVEAQGRGGLHLHMLLWLVGAPTSTDMKMLLQQQEFNDRVVNFIRTNIVADFNGTSAMEIQSMPTLQAPGYSRPLDPRKQDYEMEKTPNEHQLARTVQIHSCSKYNCLTRKNGVETCKRRAPWPLYNEDWIDEKGNWGPKRMYGYVNNWNPILLQVLRSNHDIKLLTNGDDTKKLSFYITNYATKKQSVSSNTSAILAKRFAFHKHQEKDSDEVEKINTKLLQRCANSLSREQEFSSPEVVSYIMGWGDRYFSHNYVNIYWDKVIWALIQQYPSLSRRSNSETNNPNVLNEDSMVALEVIDNRLVLKDQLRQYAVRGEGLEHITFLDFFLETYDEKWIETSHDASTGRGRPRNDCYRNLQGTERENLCRVVRSKNHETLPNIIGKWFPNESNKETEDLYFASILTLLKPWRTLRDLKDNDETFGEAYDNFKGVSPPRVLRTIDNIQYYHECANAAEDHRQHEPIQPIFTTENFMMDDSNVEFSSTLETSSAVITEEDIERAKKLRWSLREQVFGSTGITIAEDVGFFKMHGSPPSSVSSLKRATNADMIRFNGYEKKVNSMLRKPRRDQGSRQKRKDSANNSFKMYGPGVIPNTNEKYLDCTAAQGLNEDQRIAFDIIANHLNDYVRGLSTEQLLMTVSGQGGTGKSKLINAIDDLFCDNNMVTALAKTATTGVAATHINGETLHSFAGITERTRNSEDWLSKASPRTKAFRNKNLHGILYIIVDEYSMMTLDMLAMLSEILQHHRSTQTGCDATLPFGGVNIILFGDLHQFPPVARRNSALYTRNPKTKMGELGRNIYLQFKFVIELKKQMRIVDKRWNELLDRSREGECDEDDIEELKKLVVRNPNVVSPDFSASPWDETILVTPRHSLRVLWNSAATMKHCFANGELLLVSPAEDLVGPKDEPPTMRERLVIGRAQTQNTGKLDSDIDIAIGMKAIVTLNIATKGDLANGTRGKIVDIILDVRETTLVTDPDSKVRLRYPPAMILFKPDKPCTTFFDGIDLGLIPLFPVEKTFSLVDEQKNRLKVRRRQYALTAAYAFTDYKSQGQTIENVIVDLAKPPTGELTPFNAYVALSRSRGRQSIRLLRDFDPKLFTTHLSEDLRWEDMRLKGLEQSTREWWANKKLLTN